MGLSVVVLFGLTHCLLMVESNLHEPSPSASQPKKLECHPYGPVRSATFFALAIYQFIGKYRFGAIQWMQTLLTDGKPSWIARPLN